MKKQMPLAVFGLIALSVYFTFRLFGLRGYAILHHQPLPVLGLIPHAGFSQPVAWFSSMFYHNGFGHLFSNMFALLVFGIAVERDLGRKRFLTLFFLCASAGNLAFVLFLSHSTIPAMGASGGIMGIEAFYFLSSIREERAKRHVRGFFEKLIAYGPALVALLIFIAPELLMAVAQARAHSSIGGIGFLAHAGGIVAAYLFYLETDPPSPPVSIPVPNRPLASRRPQPARRTERRA